MPPLTATASPAVRQPSDRSLPLALAAARTAAENRGQDVKVLDLRQRTTEFDYFVLATGTSRRQLHAMADQIDDKLQQELGESRMGIEGYQESRWIVLDYGGVVIHLMDAEAREFYGLETLWADAAPVDLTETLRGAGGER